LNIVK